jgi:RHS repeat-associated protein
MARFGFGVAPCCLILAFSLALLSSLDTIAQVNDGTQIGYPPFGTFSGSDFDQVAFQNGNLHISIPIQSLPQRNGKTYSLHYVYDIPSWTLIGNYADSPPRWNVYPSQSYALANWRLVSNEGWSVGYQHNTVTCNNQGWNVINDVVVTDPEGTMHPVLVQLAQSGTPTTCAANVTAGLTTDGTGVLVSGSWTPPAQPTFTVTLKDGTKTAALSSWEDNNGNLQATNSDMLERNPLSVSNVGSQTYTTPLGQTLQNEPQYTLWTYTDSNGTSRSFMVNYTAIDISTHFCSELNTDCTDYSSAFLVPSSLTLPNSSGTYTFGWENADAGELWSVGLPTGGSISYTYVVGPTTVTQYADPQECVSSDGAEGCTQIESDREVVHTRSVFDGTSTNKWTYSISIGGSVTDPVGNTETHTYALIDLGGPGCPSYCSTSSYETEVQYSDSNSNLLRTIQKTYTGDLMGAGANLPYNVGNVRLISETTILPNGLQKQTQTDYEVISSSNIASNTSYNTTWLNPTAQREYDWGNGAPSTTPLRQTTSTYLHDPSSGGNYAQYLSRNIADKVLIKTVLDGSGNQIAKTTNECDIYNHPNQAMQASNAVQHDSNYSTSFVYRGNVTAVEKWLNTTGVNLTTTIQYDDAGNVLSTIDPLGNETTMSYTDSWTNTACEPSNPSGQGKAYVSSTTNALSQITRNTFNSCTGLRASTTDPNLQPTTFSYDFADRKTQTNFPDGGQVGTTYSDAPPVSATTTTKITSSLNKVSTTVKDDLGRVSQTQLTSDPQGTDYTATTYDTLGRTSTVSNPYRTTSDTTYGITTNQYDGLSRVKTVIPPDGTSSSDNTTTVYDIALIASTYDRNCTTVTDEAGKARKSCVDGLGRLTQVFEDPNGLDYETDYAYDTLDNLLSVTQHGGSPSSGNWRVRTFTHDSLSRLMCAANPEIQAVTCPTSATGTFPTFGAALYTYDSDGNVLTKTAPSPNQPSTGTKTVTTTYTYDALNRLTGKSYNDSYTSNGATPPANYAYDGNTLAGCTIAPPSLTDPYPVGSRTSMCDGSGATAWQHDKMGRIVEERRTISTIKGDYENYVINLDGSVAKIGSVALGYAVSYTYGGAARPLTATNSPTNFVTGATYAPPGELAGFTYGTSISGAVTYNSRLQPIQMYFTAGTISNTTLTQLQQTTCPTTAATIMNQSYNFGFGTNDNGNVASIANCINTNRTENFTYDSLNRVASGYSSGNQWGETYGIDAWGNLTNRSLVSGKQNYEMLNATAGTNNQLVGYTYDTAGNMTLNSSTTYTYDAENRLIWTNSGSSGYRYIYDGDGERVEKCVAATATTACPTTAGTGTLYWRGVSSDPLTETDAAGNVENTYVFFAGQRVARVDSAGAVHYYFSDHLGTHAVVENATGTACEQDIDYYPYGGEQEDYCPNVAQNYKFTGKERDSESGLDNFDKRYNASSMGRFMSPDPVFISADRLTDPQSLNLYAYVRNNPLSLVDPTGLDFYLACQTSDHSGCGQVDNGSEKGIWVQGQTVNGSFQAADVDMNKQGDPSAGYSDQFGNNYTGTFDQNGGVSFTNTAPGGATSTGSQFIDGSDNTQLNGSGAFANITGNFFSDCGGSCQGRASLSGSPEAFAATEAQLHKQSGLMTAIDRLSGAHKAGSQWKDSNGYVHMLNPSGQMEMHFEGHPTGVDVQQFVLHMVDTIRDAVSGRAATEKNTPLP